MNGDVSVNVRTDVLMAITRVAEKAMDEVAAMRQELNQAPFAARDAAQLRVYRSMPSYSFPGIGGSHQVFGPARTIAALARYIEDLEAAVVQATKGGA